MDGPPTAPCGYYLDVPNGVAWRGDIVVWKAIDSARVFETLALVAAATQSGRRRMLADLSRELVGRPTPAQVRAWLRQIEPQFLNVDADGTFALALSDGEMILPEPATLARHVARFQGRIQDDPEPRVRARNEFEGAVAEAELALARGAAPDVLLHVARGARGRGLLAHMERRSGGRFRARLLAAAHAVVSRAFMEHAEVHEALLHASRAERWLRDLDGTDVIDARIEILATRAAAERMRAALFPDEAAAALRASRAAFLRGIDLARDGVTLPPELRRSRMRWLSAEVATPISIMAEMDRASEHAELRQEVSLHVGEAEDLLGPMSVPSDVATTLLMRSRQDLLADRVSRARERLAAAEAALTRAGAAEWAVGWMPRYGADVQRAGAPYDISTIRRSLLDGWRRNSTHGFQRLMVLARFGLWKVEPIGNDRIDDASDLLAEMRSVLGRWHSDRHGRPPSKCSVCGENDGSKRGLVRRIRCTFDLDHAEWGYLSLGTWR